MKKVKAKHLAFLEEAIHSQFGEGFVRGFVLIVDWEDLDGTRELHRRIMQGQPDWVTAALVNEADEWTDDDEDGDAVAAEGE